jgi:hypothetical protein
VDPSYVEAFARAMRVAGDRAREAAAPADGTSDTYLCRECDSRWVSDDPIRWLCGNVTPRARTSGLSLDDPLTVTHPGTSGLPNTKFEILGL